MARLPSVEIEITRRSLPGEWAEEFAVEFRTTRSLFVPPPLPLPAMAWAWLGFGLAPLVAWQTVLATMFTPRGVTPVTVIDPPVETEAAVPAAEMGSNVHPFPARDRPMA